MGDGPPSGARPPENDEELIELLEHAPVGLFWVDPDGFMLWTNGTGLELLGCSGHERSGHSIAGYFIEPQAPADILSRLRRRETVNSHEASLRTRDGAVRPVLIGANSL